MAKFSESRSLGTSLKTPCSRWLERIDGVRGSAVGVVEPRVRSSCNPDRIIRRYVGPPQFSEAGA
jgi:hypothetical protein